MRPNFSNQVFIILGIFLFTGCPGSQSNSNSPQNLPPGDPNQFHQGQVHIQNHSQGAPQNAPMTLPNLDQPHPGWPALPEFLRQSQEHLSMNGRNLTLDKIADYQISLRLLRCRYSNQVTNAKIQTVVQLVADSLAAAAQSDHSIVISPAVHEMLALIQNSSTKKDPLTSKNLREILAFVWTGLIDATVYPHGEDVHRVLGKFLTALETLHSDSHTPHSTLRGSHLSALIGMSLVNSLAGTHPDVTEGRSIEEIAFHIISDLHETYYSVQGFKNLIRRGKMEFQSESPLFWRPTTTSSYAFLQYSNELAAYVAWNLPRILNGVHGQVLNHAWVSWLNAYTNQQPEVEGCVQHPTAN